MLMHKHSCGAEDGCSKLGYRFLEVLDQVLKVAQIGKDNVNSCQGIMNNAIREVEMFYNTLPQMWVGCYITSILVVVILI